jgi:hypothetical protein
MKVVAGQLMQQAARDRPRRIGNRTVNVVPMPTSDS